MSINFKDTSNISNKKPYFEPCIVYSFLVVVQFFLVGQLSAQKDATAEQRGPYAVPTSANDIHPIMTGQFFPDVELRTTEGKTFHLKKELAGQLAILIFYRGGWCPYCNLQLSRLQKIESQLQNLGYQIIAISPDRPEMLNKSKASDGLSYQLLSDSKMEAAKAFGVAFRVDDDTLIKYKGYGIDLETASGESHHLLPVPSVFVVGRNGRIGFTYANADYKVRLSSEDLIKAAQVGTTGATDQVEQILSRVRNHEFHPIRNGVSFDRHLNKAGVAELKDIDWLVRTLAVRDLVRLGLDASENLIGALTDIDAHVRHVATMVLGIVRATNAVSALENTLRNDSDPVVRSQAAIALGQIGNKGSLPLLRQIQTEDKSGDVQHQAELAAYAVEHGLGATGELAAAYRSLDERHFNKVCIGEPAIDFELPDTEGRLWKLSELRGKKPVVLIWIFADWCPVCHGEFNELIKLRNEFEGVGVEVFTLECHDVFQARVMVGKELAPKYWFNKNPFKEFYEKNIWWPHLVDRAGVVGAEYGVQPMSFVVHSEWINRPSVVIVDKEGIVRFAYYGTFWGDRPSIRQVLDMVRGNQYEFESDKRLKVKNRN